MKYKKGDRVRIKSLDWYNENKDKIGDVDAGLIFDEDMSMWCSKTMTILEVHQTYYTMKEECPSHYWTDEMIEGLVEEETKFGTASNPIEPKSNANCLTLERVDALATKIDKELPSWNQNVWELPNGYQFTDENGNVINATKIVLEKKKKEYPKTYEECCKVLEIRSLGNGTDGYKWEILSTFQNLIIFRDAYWKIAGEEMGLGKPWEPDWNDGEWKWCISYSCNCVEFDQYKSKHHTLAFPTKEMRDAFKENFYLDIEFCKELL